MAHLPATFSAQLKERAQLAFTMVNLADMAGRKRMIQYPANAVFGSFTTKFLTDRIQAAYPKPIKPPELTKKQQDRLDAHEAYRTAVLEQVSLTNYEQNAYMLAKRHARKGETVDPRSFIGFRQRCRGSSAA